MPKADDKVALTFGAVLRERRVAAALTQEALALEAGLERGFISLLERGLRQPSLRTLLVLAAPLGVSASALIRDVESRLKA